MNKKIAFITLGCKVNLYDTEAMAELLQKRAMKLLILKNMPMFTLLILAQ